MKKVFAGFVILLLLTGCSAPKQDREVPKGASSLLLLIDNESSYEEIGGRIYTEKEIRKIYLHNTLIAASNWPDTDYLMSELEIPVLRGNAEDGYYTLYKTKHSTLFVFLDASAEPFQIQSMFLLPHEPIENMETFLQLDIKTARELCKVYPPAKIAATVVIFEDLTMIDIWYETKWGTSKITEVQEWKYYPGVKDFIKRVDPMDLPAAYAEHSAEW